MSFHCCVIFRVLIDVVRDIFVTLNTAPVYFDISTEMFNSAYVLCDPQILLCIVLWLVYNREQFVKYTTGELHLHCVVDRWLMLGGYTRPQFYRTRSAWSKDQGSTKKHSAVHKRVIFIWSLILGSSWSCLIKVGPGCSRKLMLFFMWILHFVSYCTIHLSHTSPRLTFLVISRDII